MRMPMLRASPKRGNDASVGLLEALGWIDNSSASRGRSCRFFELYRSAEAKAEFAAWRADFDQRDGKPEE